MTKRDGIQAAAIIGLVVCALVLFILIRAAQIAHVQGF